MLACNQQLRNKLFKKTLILNSTVAYIININITIYIIIMQIDSVSDLWLCVKGCQAMTEGLVNLKLAS